MKMNRNGQTSWDNVYVRWCQKTKTGRRDLGERGSTGTGVDMYAFYLRDYVYLSRQEL